MRFDEHAIAQRIRQLISDQDRRDLGRVADRLAVSELGLRISIDEIAPHPTLDVMAAIISVYAVDPNWLMTGEYDPHVHRAHLDADPSRIQESLASMLLQDQSSEVRLRLIR